MIFPKATRFAIALPLLLITLFSCDKKFDSADYVAYFGGEVANPTNRFILFCRDGEVIDTIRLKEDNTFFKKFDSLTPGLYSFKHEPEYQYVYFDKNDSLMVQINSREFDQSIVFCGRGDEKNNFLMDLYLKNEADKQKMFQVFDYSIPKFILTIDSSYNEAKKLYSTKKELIKWSDDFDHFAKSALEFHHYSKKELYPLVHKIRTGNSISSKLPKDFYSYRKTIDFNDEALLSFSPYLNYISYMLNNLGETLPCKPFPKEEITLRTNEKKLQFADSLIANSKVKNRILNTIAFSYLLEDQNRINDQQFFATYSKLCTDKSEKNEILQIRKCINLLTSGKTLPTIILTDPNNKQVLSSEVLRSKTVVYFWSKNANSHSISAHRKVIQLKKNHPEYQFLAINLDSDQNKWSAQVSDYNFNSRNEYRASNFDEIKKNWVITKIHRTIILDENGVIKNAFANLFDVNFEENLN